MGWWSASILGGDEPLDYLGDLADICGVGYRDKDESEDLTKLSAQEREARATLYDYAFSAEIVNDSATRKQMIKYCQEAYSPEIAHQVLGVILMATGAKIPKTLKQKIVKSAQKDEWANNPDEERMSYIQAFIAALNNYIDGTPVFTTVEGLFQKINENLSSGQTGLVNKNI
jgi:hypothetical protein